MTKINFTCFSQFFFLNLAYRKLKSIWKTHTMFFLDGADVSLSLIISLSRVSLLLSWSSFKTSFKSSYTHSVYKASNIAPPWSVYLILTKSTWKWGRTVWRGSVGDGFPFHPQSGCSGASLNMVYFYSKTNYVAGLKSFYNKHIQKKYIYQPLTLKTL